jgi:hypothetical protein
MKCIFCRSDGCNHGNKSSDCLEGNCEQCSLGCCPLEMTDEICQYTIVEYSYETTAKGNKKLRQLSNTYQQERQQFLGLWSLEMDNFKEHSKHVKYHKNQMEQLFSLQKKELKTVICRWDFAENYVHESGSMVSTKHYGKEQSQLLIVSFWIHSLNSTISNPEIKLKYLAFTSDYLAHNTIFFDKCLSIFIDHIKMKYFQKIARLHILTDGAKQHFKNRRALNNISAQSEVQSNISKN